MKISRTFQALTSLVVLLLLAYALLMTVQIRASNQVLRSIQEIKPGQDISQVQQKLGKEMYAIKDQERILSQGSIKDAGFCQNKHLYWFYISTPPCRVVEVYTNQHGQVEFVTWQGL
jgi:hypothetical protein